MKPEEQADSRHPGHPLREEDFDAIERSTATEWADGAKLPEERTRLARGLVREWMPIACHLLMLERLDALAAAEKRVKELKEENKWLNQRTEAEYQRGLEEGSSAQAILEIQGQERFVKRLKADLATETDKRVTVLNAKIICLTDGFDKRIDAAQVARSQAEFEAARLRKANRLLHDATIVLRKGMGGHYHWDHTMQRGAGCKTCIVQRTARDEATKLLEQAAEAAKGENDVQT